MRIGLHWRKRGVFRYPLSVGIWRKILVGREKDERVNMLGFVPAVEKQRVRQLHAAERTAKGMEAMARTAQSAPSAAPRPPKALVADELTKLAALRDKGVLTEVEFAAQKAKLLAL